MAERDKHEKVRTKERMNGGRRQEKNTFRRCDQYWHIVGLGRQLSLPTGFKLPCIPECWWGRFLFNEPEDSTVFITIDVYSLYYPSTTVKPMKPPFTISLSNCEENDGIKTGRWTTLLAVTGASLLAFYQTANWQRPKLTGGNIYRCNNLLHQLIGWTEENRDEFKTTSWKQECRAFRYDKLATRKSVFVWIKWCCDDKVNISIWN